MPGSLPGSDYSDEQSQASDHDDEEGEEGEEYEEYEEEEPPFEDDILAAREMEDVPFL